MAADGKHKPKMWNKLKDAVNRVPNGLMRRISIRKNSRSRKYGEEGDDVDDEGGIDYLYSQHYAPPVRTILLAQVYSLFVDGEQQRWEKIVDEVVRISVTLEQESPKYIYHISTVDADLQGVLDTYISVPGAQLVRCTSSFVQWKDSEQGGAWGLNFISDDAANTFIALCSPSDNPKLKRSNSSVCLETLDLPDPASEFRDEGKKAPTGSSPVASCDIGDVVIDGLAYEGEPTEMTTEPGLEPTERQKQTNIPISGGVRRMLASRSNGRDIKYATYSSSRRSYFAESLYDNVSDEENGLDEDYQCSKNARKWSYADNHITSANRKTVLDDFPSQNKDSLTPAAVTWTTSKEAEGTSSGKNSRESTPRHKPKIVVNHTTLKNDSSNVVNQDIPSSPEKLNSTTLDTFEIGDGGLRPRSNTANSSNGSSRGSTKRRASRKSKIKSLIVGSSTDPQSDVENAQEHLAQTHNLLQAYELHMQKMNDKDYDNTNTDLEAFSQRSSSTRRSSSFKRNHLKTMGGDSDGGSSGFLGEFGTLNSSEGHYSQGTDDDFLDLDNLVLKDDDVDDDDSDSHSFSSLHSQASTYTQRGAVRKAGWLQCKSLLVQKKKRVERATSRKWKEYWVCLKGTMLLFYHCEDKTTPDENIEPRHILVVEGGIAQAIPEHPKRDNIFCLSTAFGDAYLLQTQSQIELENWITGIHSACASSLARQHGKDDTIRLLRSEVHKLEAKVESETKMKKMAELQLTVVTHTKNRQAIVSQIAQWDQNLERFHLELYRLRCYMASLQGSELPNPKTLLACVSKPTKHTLAKLDFFSVSSFHALVSARNPMGLQGRFSKPRSKKQKGLFGTLKRSSKGATALAADAARLAESHNKTTAPPAQFEESDQKRLENDEEKAENHPPISQMFERQMQEERSKDKTLSEELIEGALVKVLLPDNQSTIVTLRPGMTVQDLLIGSCVNRQMDYHNYYVKFNQAMRFGAEFKIPDKNAILEKEKFDGIEICIKCIHQVELYKFNENMDFGFTVEAELGDDAEREDQLCIFISVIEKGGLAYHQDLHVGDELLCIEGRVVCDLDMLFIENLLQTSSSVTLTVRSSRTVFAQTQAMLDTNKYIDQLTCPPPPSQNRLTDDMIDLLIIPAPNTYDESDASDTSLLSTSDPSHCPSPLRYMYDPVEEEHQNQERARQEKDKRASDIERHPKQIEQLLKGVEQITDFCRTMDMPDKEEEERRSRAEGRDGEGGRINDATILLQSAQKLRKVILELQDTERAYVKDLNLLVTRYLEPLQSESFLTADEIDALFGNIKEIIKFQTVFLKGIEDSTDVPEYETFSNPAQFKRILFSLGGAFLYYMDHFKLYSSFCACHSRSQKILDPARGNKALMEFLEARNPKNQHSSSLASYLIKPIQRVLKYPLLLHEMRSQLDVNSEEHYHLSQAHKGMSQVAGHINDMMRVHEEYGDIFDGLVSEQYHVKKELVGTKVADLAMDDLVLYNSALWLNSQDDLGKFKRGKEPEVIVFVFRPAVVIICKEKSKKPRKSSMKGNGQLTEDVIRFKWMIPVSAMQVKDASINDSDYLSLWELAHTKSEGKSEKFFQFSCSTSELKSLFVKTIKQIIRDHKYNKNTTTSGKFTLGRPKNYTPFSGKRLEGLSQPKRTLRKSLQRGEGNRTEGSQCSEERSSGSGSMKGDRSEGDQFDSLETDSNSTGKDVQMLKRRSSLDSGMHSNDSNSLTGSNRDSDPLNTNVNNNIQRSTSENDSVFGSPTCPLTPMSEEGDWTTFNEPSPAVLSHQEIRERLAMMELSVASSDSDNTPKSPESDIATANRTLNMSGGAVSVPTRNRNRKLSQRGSLYDNMKCDSVEEEGEQLKDATDTNSNFVTDIPGSCIN